MFAFCLYYILRFSQLKTNHPFWEWAPKPKKRKLILTFPNFGLLGFKVKTVCVKEFFDFETTTDSKYHKPYLCRIADDDQVFVNNHLDKKQYDKMIGYQLLKYLTVKNGYKNLRLYAHNAGYDIKFLFDLIELMG